MWGYLSGVLPGSIPGLHSCWLKCLCGQVFTHLALLAIPRVPTHPHWGNSLLVHYLFPTQSWNFQSQISLNSQPNHQYSTCRQPGSSHHFHIFWMEQTQIKTPWKKLNLKMLVEQNKQCSGIPHFEIHQRLEDVFSLLDSHA